MVLSSGITYETTDKTKPLTVLQKSVNVRDCYDYNLAHRRNLIGKLISPRATKQVKVAPPAAAAAHLHQTHHYIFRGISGNIAVFHPGIRQLVRSRSAITVSLVYGAASLHEAAVVVPVSSNARVQWKFSGSALAEPNTSSICLLYVAFAVT